MLKRILIVLFFNLIVSYLNYSKAQSTNIDSLQRVVKTTQQDTSKCFSLIILGENYYYRDPDSAMYFLRQGESLAKDIVANTKNTTIINRTKLFWAYGLSLKGYAYMYKSEKDSAFNVFKESLALSEQINDKSGMATSYVNLGEMYFNNADILKSLESHHKGLKLFLELNEKPGIAAAYNNLGSVYKDQGDIPNALEYFQKALQTYEELKDPLSISGTLNNVAIIYKDQGDPTCKGDKKDCRKKSLEKALTLMMRVLKLYTEIGDKSGIGTALNNIGMVYKEQGKIPEAIEYLQKSQLKSEEVGNKRVSMYALGNMAEMMCDYQNKCNEALTYAKKCYSVSREIGYPETIKFAATILAKIYKKQNNFKEALAMQELSVQMRDSVANAVTRKASVKKQIQIEYERKAQRDSLANESKIIKEQLQHEQELAQQRAITYIGLIGFAFMLIIAFVSFRAYKNKQKANIIITEQKQVAESQKQQIEIANKDLERQHLLNQKIFSVISHDFRGPMLSLSLMLDKFRLKSNDTALNTYVQEVNTEVNNANAILNNLLNWARTEINIQSFEETFSDLNTIASEIHNEFITRLELKNLNLQAFIPAGSTMDIPPDIMRITLRNLISNAIKYSQSGKDIELRYTNHTLMVKDSGMGMAPEKSERLFKKEVDTELGTNNEEGFGIGLYIVAELLHKYGHRIQVQSELNKGTLFSITKV